MDEKPFNNVFDWGTASIHPTPRRGDLWDRPKFPVRIRSRNLDRGATRSGKKKSTGLLQLVLQICLLSKTKRPS